MSRNEFKAQNERHRKSIKNRSVWSDPGFAAFCASVAIYMGIVLVLGGFESPGDAIRMLVILTTFGITFGCVHHELFKK